MGTEKKTTYQIGTIAIDSDGMWTVYFLGQHGGQGGVYFGPGNVGSKRLADLFKIVRHNLNKCKSQYLKQIAELEAAPPKEDTTTEV